MRVLFFLLFLSQVLFAQNEELAINFIDNDFDKALTKAKDQEKIIFIDAYTTWCGPCKMMDREVFTDSAIGDFYNENFVNLKLDMEKGKGEEVAKRYGVRSYPTFLFINSAGALIHQGLGYQSAERFKKIGETALDPNKQLPALEARYSEGDRSEDLMYNYTVALLEAGDSRAKEIGKQYLEMQDTWTTRRNMEIIGQLVSEYQDPYYNFIVEKRHLFIKEFGEGRVDGTLLSLIENHYYNEIEEVDLAEVKQVINNTFPSSKAGTFYDNFELNYYDVLGKKDIYIDKARKYVKKNQNLSANALNSIAWNFYEKIDDKKGLRWATKIAKKSISKEDSYYNNDTLAALFYKRNKKNRAERYAHKAIELAKEAGADFSETSELLNKIEAMPD
ncbi:MAG: thioredoxin family protein [Saprospiraceae bacterium]|nr:thioredoxin family protein [Saprospiraceae bacterium]